MCVPCMSSAHLFQRSIKMSKIQIYFYKSKETGEFFPEGASPLCAGVTTRNISKWQGGVRGALCYRKVAEPSTRLAVVTDY